MVGCVGTHASLLLARDRVDRGGGDRAAAATAAYDEVVQPEPLCGQRVLGLGGADEADRDADDGGRAGAPSSIISRSRNRAVGALPIATTAPSAGPATARGRPRCGWCRGRRRGPGRTGRQGAEHVVAGGQPLAGDAAGDHVGVAQDRRAGAQRLAGSATTSGECARSRTRSTMPQAWIMRTATWLTSAGSPRGPPRRGWWRRTGGRSRRRPSRRSREFLDPVGAALLGGCFGAAAPRMAAAAFAAGPVEPSGRPPVARNRRPRGRRRGTWRSRGGRCRRRCRARARRGW